MFLGAGVSRDSYDSKGNLLPDGDKIRRQLCSINNFPESTPLTQAQHNCFLIENDTWNKHADDILKLICK